MRPSFYYWWKCAQARAEREGESVPAAPHFGGGERRRPKEHQWHASGRDFGVRRPLRFMAHRLDLDDEQVQELARILNTLKTERAQREVDNQRALSDIADVLGDATFNADKAEQAIKSRIAATERLERAVLAAIRDTHALLDEEQRGRLAYMLRSGQLSI